MCVCVLFLFCFLGFLCTHPPSSLYKATKNISCQNTEFYMFYIYIIYFCKCFKGIIDTVEISEQHDIVDLFSSLWILFAVNIACLQLSAFPQRSVEFHTDE